ncbi:hypothetical protein JCM30237_15020 [Halolamina litorea]|uniref:Uncharacterized protein n=1 Tax=Halolamina litorea TaxID=1515593 RepID=A0ABD6BMC3_9EURY|nr:hypothetical protein [Halolamina litorea]
MDNVLTRFDDRIRAIGDPDPPASPLTLRAATGYLLRRATPALVPVVVAVVMQFVVSNPLSGVLTATGAVGAAVGGVAGAALALERRGATLVAVVAATALVVGPVVAVADGSGDLFAVHLGLFGVVTLFVVAVCYAETASLRRADGGGRSA